MKTRIIAALALLTAIASLTAVGQLTTQTRYNSRDTIKIKWSDDDSSIVIGSQNGQLLKFILRNNDYDLTDGIEMSVKTPDGDSTLAGIGFYGNGTAAMVGGGLPKQAWTQALTYSYGDYRFYPNFPTPTVAPKVYIGDNSNASYLSMSSTSKVIQLEKGLNFRSSAPAAPEDGDVWRVGNVLYFRMASRTIGFDYTINPVAGMGWRFNGTNYAPGYPDTSGSVGGGGGGSTWDSLGTPGADLNLDMLTYSTVFTWGDYIGTPFIIRDNAGSTNDYLLRVITHPANSTRRVVLLTGAGGNGVEILNNGTMQVVNSGQISATKWKGLDTVRRADLPAKVAYEDETNTFTTPQTVSINANNVGLSAVNTYSGGGYGLQGSHAGSSGAGVLGTAYGAAIGVHGSSASGYGVYANSTSGIPMVIAYTDAIKLSFGNLGLYPSASGGYSVGNEALHMGDVYTDSLFVGATKDSTLDWRGDGKMFKAINRTTVFASDTVIINIPGIDSTYDATWYFIGKTTMLASPGGRCYNNGNVELTSSTSPMVGTYVSYRVWKRN